MAFQSKVLHVYTDGSALDNGSLYAKGGWAVYFAQYKHIFEDAQGNFTSGAQTNNRYELEAIRYALTEMTRNIHDAYFAVIHTDSQYAINALDSWIYQWQMNGFRTSNGAPVMNRDLILECYELMETLKSRGWGVRFEHVRGHSNDPLNNLVDRQAREMAARNPVNSYF